MPFMMPTPGGRVVPIEPLSPLIVVADEIVMSFNVPSVAGSVSVVVSPPPVGWSKPQCALPVATQPHAHVVSTAFTPAPEHVRTVLLHAHSTDAAMHAPASGAVVSAAASRCGASTTPSFGSDGNPHAATNTRAAIFTAPPSARGRRSS